MEKTEKVKKRRPKSLHLTYAVESISNDGEVVRYDNIRDASAITGIRYSSIYGCIIGRLNQAGGLMWRKEGELAKPEIEKPKMYVSACSFGKDSLATVLLAYEMGEPLDAIVFSEVMYSHSRKISGEIPEHIEWVYSHAIPKLEELGLKVTVVRDEQDYFSLFHHVRQAGKYIGKKNGFPMSAKCEIQKVCKLRPIDRWCRQFKKEYDIVSYIGIATDEEARLTRLDGVKKVSLLAKYGYTEQMAMELCQKYDLVSPIYELNQRNGCWFCMNGPISHYVSLRAKYPYLWRELKLLDRVEGRVTDKFKFNLTLSDIEQKMNIYEESLSRQVKLYELVQKRDEN